MHPDCETFSIGNEASKTFFSPGYPGNYTKSISCVRVLRGKKEKLVHLLISLARLKLDAVHKQNMHGRSKLSLFESIQIRFCYGFY